MLLEMDRPLDGPALRHPECSVATQKWLVGLPFHARGCQTVWMYYIVDRARDRPQAVWAAKARAGREADGRCRGGPAPEAGPVEVRRIMEDPIGNVTLGCS
ncbi:hypothetical protein AB0D38_26930 [Streptomyces sp. NPDC048279]|uniref:hypothetical protein n=1 Tax=Streptomyces sp. NPDC048279 TaxID=3154714 RepID=UPI003426271C